MEKHLKQTRASRLRQRDKILSQLEKKEPVLTAELRAVLVALDDPSMAEGEYSTFTKPFPAITKFLEDAQVWTDQTAIARAIVEGGYKTDPILGVQYLTATIRYSVKRKKLLEFGELIGLPTWDLPKA